MSLADALALRQGCKPFRHLDRPLEVIRQFTPHWFAVTMGTGILALTLAAFPLSLPGLHALAESLWLFNALLFSLFTGLYAARWLLFYQEAREIFAHATVSMFLGTIPMGLATLINGLLLFGLPRWGEAVLPLALGLWWLDAAMALACGVLIPYLMFTRQAHRIDQMTAVWLLPVVAAEVVAASGGLLVPHLTASEQFTVLVASYVLWAYSVPVALSLLVILLLRLALHKLPPASMAASSWLALGPIATGALGLLVLGADAPTVFAAHGLAGIGEIARGLGLLGAVLLWGLGLWWLALAVLVTQRQAREGMPFNLSWWGFTFPLGVYALTTLRLGEALAAPFFTGLGTVLVVLLALLWTLVASRTLAGAYQGSLFVSPCIAHLCQKAAR
ncbi:C4-dicarboxylate ABC transporter [Pseudomonas oryzihabitans]|uniref:SLAC1 family transporter n=1 Tax=Pseudomonas oryzihabitans TaxID=47885 RepID=UPI00214EA3FB|nr:C4-dicarboxylate ABC transporter [Pseudomonas psychrotolerans]UUW71291.1 C4-dicarboxylate ABC transporter [Pseudomonas psychrotolerans]